MATDGAHRASRASVLAYLLAGALAAAANYASRFLFSLWLPFELAVAAAFLVGLATGFVLMRRFAFSGASNDLRAQVLGYLLVNAFAAVQTLAVSSLLARVVLPAAALPLDHEALAHAAGVLVPVITSYFGHRRITFR